MRKRWIAPASGLIMLLLMVDRVHAQTESPASQSPLTLNELLQQVETNYPKLVGADAERRAASAKRLSTQGAFDPQVSVLQDYTLYNSSTSPGRARSLNSQAVGIEMATRYGTKLIAGRDLNFGAVKSPASSTGTEGTYYVGVRHPLFRGAGINDKAAKERQARLGEPLADSNFALTRLDVLQEASNAYWKWAATVRKQAIAEELLRIAEIRASAIREEVRQGIRAAAELPEADGEVALRKQSQIQAQRSTEEAAFKLQKYLWQSPDTPAPPPTVAALPADALTLTPVPLTETEIADNLRLAVQTRPELRVIDLNRRIVGIDASLARNDLRPAVDLVFYPGQDFGRQAIGDTLKTGVVFTVPLYQRDARGRLEEANLKAAKFEQEQTLAQQTIQIEVNDAVSAVQRAAERFKEAEEALRLALVLEQLERVRWREGDSTLFVVNLRERLRGEAASRLVDVRADYEQARAQLRRVSAQF